MTETLKFPAGSAITFTSGEYSDFRTCGTLIMLKDVDLAERVQAYIAGHQPKHGWDDPEPGGLPAFLITSGFAMAADVQEVHLGSYGEFEREFLAGANP